MDKPVKKRQTILIADDSEMNRSILIDLLGNKYNYKEAQNGAEAVEIISAHENSIDLLILDLVMPKMDGFDVLSVMKDREWIGKIPVIVICAENIPDNLQKAFLLGAADYISRPFDSTIVRHRVMNTMMIHISEQRISQLIEKHISARERLYNLLTAVLSGDCEALDPALLERLSEMTKEIQAPDEDVLRLLNLRIPPDRRMEEDMDNVSVSKRTFDLLQYERSKYRFFASMSQEIQFEYKRDTRVLTLSEWGTDYLSLPEIIPNPIQNEKLLQIFGGKEKLKELTRLIWKMSPGDPVLQFDCEIFSENSSRWCRIICSPAWTFSAEKPVCTGIIGKITDIHQDYTRIADLQRRAFQDPLTGLYNISGAGEKIRRYMEENPEGRFALIIFDLDHFKMANDRYGHLFGDQVLKYIAEKLRKSVRSNDIAARAGGDEFMVFLQYRSEIENAVKRIFNALTCEYEGFPVAVSMGIACTDQAGRDYETLFHCADQALYSVKRSGRGKYRFYDDSLKDMFSVISPIESDQTKEES